MNVSPRGLRALRSRPASRRQRTDMVVLAHIKEQSRLSLGSYGSPRMTEEVTETGLEIGHRLPGNGLRANRERGRVGRVRRENRFTSQLIPRINCFCSHPDCFLNHLTAPEWHNR